MLSSNKLNVYRDDALLSLEYKWFSPIAIFMVFFCVIWFAFLAFWYGMAASTGAPWIFFVFPLLHVSVGAGLAYYALCLLFNKTKIIINDEILNVIHYPVPWWKGNKKLDTNDLEQIYVKEKVRRGKNNSKNYTYTIRGLLKGGKDIELAAIGGLQSQDALQIENYLEQFLGIDNYPVKGEYGAKETAQNDSLPRRIRSTSLPGMAGKIYGLKAGDNITLNDLDHEVAHLTQYDWKNGQTDKLFQLLPEKGKDQLVYLHKNNALVQPFTEELLDLQDSQRISFSANEAPKSLLFQGQQYLLTSKASGKAFLTVVTKPVDVQQWVYQASRQGLQLRIVVNEDMVSYFLGCKTKWSAFKDQLDEPLDLPRLDPEKLTGWEDEELV